MLFSFLKIGASPNNVSPNKAASDGPMAESVSLKLVFNVSEGVVIEGKNKVFLNDCILVDSNTSLNGQSTTYKKW